MKDNAQYNEFSALVNKDEEIISVFNENGARDYLETNSKKKSFAILTDKRLYTTGKHLKTTQTPPCYLHRKIYQENIIFLRDILACNVDKVSLYIYSVLLFLIILFLTFSAAGVGHSIYSLSKIEYVYGEHVYNILELSEYLYGEHVDNILELEEDFLTENAKERIDNEIKIWTSRIILCSALTVVLVIPLVFVVLQKRKNNMGLKISFRNNYGNITLLFESELKSEAFAFARQVMFACDTENSQR